jgi:hypothetical protein
LFSRIAASGDRDGPENDDNVSRFDGWVAFTFDNEALPFANYCDDLPRGVATEGADLEAVLD